MPSEEFSQWQSYTFTVGQCVVALLIHANSASNHFPFHQLQHLVAYLPMRKHELV